MSGRTEITEKSARIDVIHALQIVERIRAMSDDHEDWSLHFQKQVDPHIAEWTVEIGTEAYGAFTPGDALYVALHHRADGASIE